MLKTDFITCEQGTILLTISVERNNEMNCTKIDIDMEVFLILYMMKPSKIHDSALLKGCINSKFVTLRIFKIFE